MSDTPRTDAAFARCIEEGGPYEPFHGPLIEESEALERELTQAQARCAEVEKLLRECLEMADNWPGIAYSYDLVRRAEAALKAQR